MIKKSFIVNLSIVVIMFFSLCGTSNSASNPLTVKNSGGNIVVRQDGEFELVIEGNRGGVIAQYYDLKTDPGKTTNIAAHSNQGILYHGLYFTMFKQGGGDLPWPEQWTAQFQNRAKVEVKYKSPKKVLVHVSGPFHGHFSIPASFDIVYTIQSDPDTSGALIYIRSRIIFNNAFSNSGIPYQIRQAFCLVGGSYYGVRWNKYSQGGLLSPWYAYRPKDDYIGATINTDKLKVDPLMILHRDWPLAVRILTIGPPNYASYSFMAWVAYNKYNFAANQVIEKKYLIRMDQTNLSASNRAKANSLAKAYRESDGGDFIGEPDVQPQVHIPLLLLSKADVPPPITGALSVLWGE